MRLSTSLSRNVMNVAVGTLLNRFKLKSRRNTLFFEDILAIYVKKCDDAGYGRKIEESGITWMNLYLTLLMPERLKNLPPTLFLNTIISPVWTNLGLLNNFHIDKEGDTITIHTRGELVTRSVGENSAATGLYIGVINSMFGRKAKCIEAKQTKESCRYVFKLGGTYSPIEGKGKEVYNRLNLLPNIKGFTLKDALEKNVFVLQDNKIYFRGGALVPVENTIFHILSNIGALLEEIPGISYDYFKEKIEDSSADRKLTHLKTLFQTMGWGVMKILWESPRLSVDIQNPPYGLQVEKDNWAFLANTILGYLWLIDEGFRIGELAEGNKRLTITYTTDS